jgi:hypothetical protein
MLFYNSITGNETADAMAKDGATNQESLCAHTFSSKAWLYAKTRAQFNLNWEKEIPQAHHNLTFPHIYNCLNGRMPEQYSNPFVIGLQTTHVNHKNQNRALLVKAF